MTRIPTGKTKLNLAKRLSLLFRGSQELQRANSSKLILLLKHVTPTDDWINSQRTALSAGCQ